MNLNNVIHLKNWFISPKTHLVLTSSVFVDRRVSEQGDHHVN